MFLTFVSSFSESLFLKNPDSSMFAIRNFLKFVNFFLSTTSIFLLISLEILLLVELIAFDYQLVSVTVSDALKIMS